MYYVRRVSDNKFNFPFHAALSVFKNHQQERSISSPNKMVIIITMEEWIHHSECRLR